MLGMPYRSLPEPTKTVGAVLETQSFNPLRSGRNHLRSSRPHRESRSDVSTRSSIWSAWRRRAGATPERTAPCASGSGSARRCSATPILILDEFGERPPAASAGSATAGFAAEGNAVLVSSTHGDGAAR